jgi:mRNA interferase MazF
MTVWRRGEIWLTDFNPAKGGEIGKLRSAVVLSDEESNAILETVMVVPLSTVIEPDTFPYRLTLPPREELHRESDACIYEIRTVSKQRLKKRIAVLEPQELETIQKALCELITQ